MLHTDNLTEKYKIWDNLNKKWFRPEYPGIKTVKGKQVNTTQTREILFSQTGELYLIEKDGDSALTITYLSMGTKEEPGPFIPCLYTGIKDENEKKAYLNDEVLFEGEQGFVTWYDCGFAIKTLTGTYPLSAAFKFEITGNILENENTTTQED